MDWIMKDQTINHPDRSILTIYTGPEKFSFSLYDPKERGSYSYTDLAANNPNDAFSAFKEAFFEKPLFSLPFRKVLILNRTSNFIFVPHSFYKEQHREKFLHFLLSDQQGMALTCSVSSAKLTVLYQMPENVYQFILRSFDKPEFIHYSAPLITYFLEKVKSSNVRRMVVNLQEKGVDIFCFSEKTFLLGNYFPCQNLSETVYFILYTWKQLQLNQTNDYLHIIGNAVFKEELIHRLTSYLQHIYCPSILPEIYFEGVNTDKVPFELAALPSCGL